VRKYGYFNDKNSGGASQMMHGTELLMQISAIFEYMHGLRYTYQITDLNEFKGLLAAYWFIFMNMVNYRTLLRIVALY
jgi:hypothetical protein